MTRGITTTFPFKTKFKLCHHSMKLLVDGNGFIEIHDYLVWVNDK